MRGRLISLMALVMGLVSLRGVAMVATEQGGVRSQEAGEIGGVVVGGDGGARPLRNAYVVVIGAKTGTLRITSTDANGQFRVKGLPADRYTVGASKPPYLGAVAGAKRPTHPGTPIALAAGQAITDLTIRLTPGAVIAGTVSDNAGKPAANMVVALQQWKMQGTGRTLVSIGAGRVVTDEQGRYRFYGLAPGEYVLAATPPMPLTSAARRLSDADVDNALRGGPTAPRSPTDAPVRYAPVYFPGTPRASDAQSIALGPGESREGVDLRLVLTRVATVDGIVTLADGRPTPATVLLLNTFAEGATSTAALPTRAGADGRFAFANAFPGTYTLVASLPGPTSDQLALTTVDVAGADVTGLDLVFGPALRLSGRVACVGTAAAPPLAGLRVALQTLATVPAAVAPIVAPTSASGAFSITRVTPGRYLLGAPIAFGAMADSVAWTLDSVVVAGKDVTDLPFEVTSESAINDALVTLTDRWQSLSGRLTLANGGAASDDTIVVFPSDKAYWPAGSRRIRVTRPSSDGTFVIGGSGVLSLPAGAYLLAAVADLDRDEQLDPAFLASLVPAAIPATVLPGEKKVQDLAIR
jgi:carboxypeptidase family protein